MKRTFFTKVYRLLFAITAIALMGLPLSKPAQAADLESGLQKTYYIEITGVDKNKTITVKATGFPVKTDFKVRVGPFDDFHKKAVNMGTINTGAAGKLTFNVTLPSAVKDIKLVTVRLDGPNKQYSYNVFTNAASGKIEASPNAWLPSQPNVTPTVTPTATPGATQPPSGSYSCQIVSVEPPQANFSMPTRNDFDAIWTVKNTGSREWSAAETDYKYISGDKIHKHKTIYDLSKTVKPGETVKIMVDMFSPTTAGTYTTTWNLGGFCSLPVTITVK